MKNKQTICLCILDGWGEDKPTAYNAITNANTPHYNALKANHSFTLLSASGRHVGLPNGQFGNSEVGHQTIGSGRVIPQDLTRVHNALKAPHNQINQWLNHTNPKVVHLIILASTGGVHSHIEHLLSCIQHIRQQDKRIRIAVHAITDGRDRPPRAFLEDIKPILNLIDEDSNIVLSTIIGRYYAMDRDGNWDRTALAYNILKNASLCQSDITTLINQYYDCWQDFNMPSASDEFIPPTALSRDSINAEDAVVFLNFRADRAIQLTQALTSGFKHNGQLYPPLISPERMMTATSYPNTSDDLKVLCPPENHTNTLGDVLSDHNIPQYRIAETEKYAHVTFFFNLGRSKPANLEHHILIPSPDVATYDQQPEMSAKKITDAVIATDLSSPGVIVVNYANPDMVGHSGDLNATVKAIECVDECLGRLISWQQSNDIIMLVTADHGNADCLYDEVNNQPHTRHTLAKVPFIYVSSKQPKLRVDATLADIAPTVLKALNIAKPTEMTGESIDV